MTCSSGCMEDGFVGVIDGHALGPQKKQCSLAHLDPSNETDPKRYGTAHQDRVLIPSKKTRDIVIQAFTLDDTTEHENDIFIMPKGIDLEVRKKVEAEKKKKRTIVKVEIVLFLS